MFDEDINNFVDGKPLDEKDIATVVGFVDSVVILADDDENVFYLNDSAPSAFEIGTIQRKDALIPLSSAGEQLKEKILAVLRKGRS